MQHFQPNGYDGYHLCPSCAATFSQVHPQHLVDTVHNKLSVLGKLSVSDINYLNNNQKQQSGEIPHSIKDFLQNYLNIQNVGNLDHRRIQNYILEAKNHISETVLKINGKPKKSDEDKHFLRFVETIFPNFTRFRRYAK
jgi:hypothetical protein